MVGANFAGAAGGEMAAEIEHGDLAAAREHRVDIMLHHESRDLPLAHEIAQMLEQMQRLCRRKACARLVQQQQMRAADQGQRDVHPALHAIGDAAGFLMEIAGEIHHLDHVIEPVIAEMLRNQMKLLMDGEILEYAGALERARHALPAPPGHRAPRDILVAIANGSRDRTAAATHRVEQRGFAGTVRSDHTVKDAVAKDFQIDVRQGADRSIAHGKVLDLEHVRTSPVVRRTHASAAMPCPTVRRRHRAGRRR